MSRESNREIIWAEIRKQGEFTQKSLEQKTRVNEDTIRTYVRGLLKAGFIEQVGEIKNELSPFVRTTLKSKLYRLVNDIGVDTPRVTRDGRMLKPDLTADLWRSMRILKCFSVEELCFSISRDVKYYTAETYCVFLHKAGYLRRNEGKYWLINNSGPRAPKIRRIKAVYDPNLKKVVWSSGEDAA